MSEQETRPRPRARSASRPGHGPAACPNAAGPRAARTRAARPAVARALPAARRHARGFAGRARRFNPRAGCRSADRRAPGRHARSRRVAALRDVAGERRWRAAQIAGRRCLSLDQTALVLDRTGNTSSGSVPLALADALDAGRVEGR